MEGEDEREEDNSAGGKEETTFSNLEVTAVLFFF